MKSPATDSQLRFTCLTLKAVLVSPTNAEWAQMSGKTKMQIRRSHGRFRYLKCREILA